MTAHATLRFSSFGLVATVAAALASVAAAQDVVQLTLVAKEGYESESPSSAIASTSLAN